MRFSVASRFYAVAGAALCPVIVVAAWWQRRELPVFWNLVDEGPKNFLSQTLFHLGGQPVRVWFLIKTFLFLVFLNLVSRLAKKTIHYFMRGNPAVDKQRGLVFTRIISLLIYVVGILIGIRVEKLNLSTLAFVGGTVGVVIGFGLQTLVSNFVSGLILLIEQPIRLGDRIEFGDKSGEVVRMGSRASWIKTYDNAVLIVPNSDFTTKQILNWTVSDPKTRISVPVSVAYGSDPQQVISILVEVANGHAEVMSEPVPSAILSEMGASSLNFTLRAWTLTGANEFGRLRSDLFLEILKRFEQEKIEIPFSQLDLHLKPVEAANLTLDL